MIDVPSLSAIAQMSEAELRSAYAQLLDAFIGEEHEAEEQAQLLLALQRIKIALGRKRLSLRP